MKVTIRMFKKIYKENEDRLEKATKRNQELIKLITEPLQNYYS